jgi:hypothetical protein
VNEPLLERATRALRSTADASPAQLGRALERLERAQRSRRPSRRWLRSAAWTLAATLAGAGAWANATGRVHWFGSAPESPPAPAQTLVPAAARQHAPTALPPPSAVASDAPAVDAPASDAPPVDAPSSDAPVARALPAPRRAAPAARPAEPHAEPAPSPPAVDRADELYREAHAAHFVRADYGAALVAWDRYLAAAGPGHRWALEARYNRGIALYHLGQVAAARRALQPFADGEYGGYRREAARRLLEALPGAE